MSGAQMDPHNKMRARDVNKVARGEQAPRPAHEFGTVSPPPSSVHTKKQGEKAEKAENGDYKARHCYVKYVEYHRCIKQKGEKAPEYQKLGKNFRSSCPNEWIEEWDAERKEGGFPADT